MKAYIIQPFYSFEESDIEKCFNEMIALLDTIEDDADIIVLPEYCDVPVSTKSKNNFHAAIEKYNEIIKYKAREAARRCHSIVFFSVVVFPALVKIEREIVAHDVLAIPEQRQTRPLAVCDVELVNVHAVGHVELGYGL